VGTIPQRAEKASMCSISLSEPIPLPQKLICEERKGQILSCIGFSGAPTEQKVPCKSTIDSQVFQSWSSPFAGGHKHHTAQIGVRMGPATCGDQRCSVNAAPACHCPLTCAQHEVEASGRLFQGSLVTGVQKGVSSHLQCISLFLAIMRDGSQMATSLQPMCPRPPIPMTPTRMPLRVMKRAKGAKVVTPPHMRGAASTEESWSGILKAKSD
jgi:hypothetical protein